MVRRHLTVLLLVLLFPIPSVAQTICPPQDYTIASQPNFDCPSPGEAEMVPDLRAPVSIPVHSGEAVAAPWDGALVHRDRLVELGLRVHALRRLRWADTLHLAAQYAVNLEHVQELGRVQLEHMTAQRDAYQERWQAAEERASRAERWWHSPALWVGVGVVVAGCLVALTAYGLSAVD